jgi:hypothetical protein
MLMGKWLMDKLLTDRLLMNSLWMDWMLIYRMLIGHWVMRDRSFSSMMNIPIGITPKLEVAEVIRGVRRKWSGPCGRFEGLSPSSQFTLVVW